MAFVRHFATNSPVMLAQKRRAMIIFGLALGLPAVHLATINPLVGLIFGAVAVAVGTLIFGSLMRTGTEKLQRKFYSQPGCTFLGPHDLTIEERGIHSVGTTGEATYFWTTISSIDQTETHCFIYLNAVTAFAIPLDNIKEGNVDDFIDEVTRRWQAAKP